MVDYPKDREEVVIDLLVFDKGLLQFDLLEVQPQLI